MFEAKLMALIVAAALNPLVVRAPEPHGAIPADCEFADRPPVRVQIAEAEPQPAAPLPPVRIASRASTTAHIEELRRALASNDRAAYDAALARAREAGAATRVYDDISRLWDAQFESPFFAEGSEPHRIASSHPGYEAAVRRQVFTDARGRKFYPAAESRAFVAQQVGVSASAPSRTTTTPSRRASADEPSPSPSRRSSPSLAGPRKTQPSKPPRSSPSPASSKSRTSVARRSPAASEAAHPIPSAPPRTAATEPAPVVPPAVDTSSTEAPPAAGSTAAPGTAAVDTATPAPVPTSSAAPADAPAAPAGAPATTTATQTKGRSIVLPAILILIGLGVLIVLFRTAR